MTLYVRPAELDGNTYEIEHDDHPGANLAAFLSVAIRRAAQRIPRPLPTALMMLEQAGVNVDGNAR